MRFTNDRPSTEGFYFVRFRGRLGGQLGVGVVKVTRTLGALMAFWDGEIFPVTDECFLQFAGPVPIPEGDEVTDVLERVESALRDDPTLHFCVGPRMIVNPGIHVSARQGCRPEIIRRASSAGVGLAWLLDRLVGGAVPIPGDWGESEVLRRAKSKLMEAHRANLARKLSPSFGHEMFASLRADEVVAIVNELGILHG
jgi:hypothetical protein